MPTPDAETPATGFTNSATEVCHLLNDNERPPPGAGAAGPPAGDPPPEARTAVLELRVRNHPGTMSHVTGLFARRGFNLDAIVCAPEGAGATSRMLLLVAEEPRLDQVERQLAKLYDVLSLRHRPDLDADWFTRLL